MISHFGVIVEDLEKTIKWYKDIFGFEELRRFQKPELEINAAVLMSENVVIEFIEPKNPIKIKNNIFNKSKNLKDLLKITGSTHIGINVENLNKTYEILQKNNLVFISEIYEDRLFFCMDFNNLLLEIKQKK